MKKNYFQLILHSIICLALSAHYLAAAEAENRKIEEGMIISSVQFVPEGMDLSSIALPDLKTKVGSKYNRRDLDYDIESLFATGNFKDVTAKGSVMPDGRLRVRFLFNPAYFIESVDFEGDKYFSSDKLEETLNITFLTRFEEELADRSVTILKSFFASEGFYNAEIQWKFEPDKDSSRGDLVFYINAGAPARIKKIEFIQTEGLDPDIDVTKLDLWDLKKLERKRYSLEELNDRLNSIKEKLWEANYLTTRIDHVGTNYNKSENTVVVQLNFITDGKLTITFSERDFTMDIFKDLLFGQSIRKLSSDLLYEWTSKIRDYYIDRGYLNAKVYSSSSKKENKDSILQIKETAIRFLIRKELRHYLQNIVFKGNQHFSEDYLKQYLMDLDDLQKQRIFFTGDTADTYISRLNSLYKSAGYLNIKIVNNDIRKTDSGNKTLVELEFFIDENIPSLVREIRIEGVSPLPFSPDEFLERMNTKVGYVFKSIDLNRDIEKLRSFLDELGYSDININSDVFQGEEYDTYVKIVLQFRQKSRVGNIILNGNFITDTDYLLDNLTFKKGDSINREALLRSQLKLYDLGMFSKIEFYYLTADIAAKETRVLLKVQESHSILMTYGLGIDTENLLRGTFGLAHNNIAGKGRKANLRFTYGAREKLAQIGYQDPDFLKEKWGFFASLFYEEQVRESFSMIRRGGVLQFSLKESQNLTNLISFNVENVDLFDVKISPLLIPAEDRAVNLTSISSTVVIDFRDDPFDPLEGFFISGNVKWSSPIIGSEEGFIKGYFQSNFYIPLVSRSILAVGFRLGMAVVFKEDRTLPPSERFFAGGSNTIRAYPLDSVGPIDTVTGYPIGGNALLLANAELRIPLFGQFGMVLFWDGGSVFDKPERITIKNLSHSLGLGVRFNTPVGPLRLDWGFNPDNLEQNQIYVSIGHAF